MKALLVVLVLLVAGGVGFAFYEGWFRLSTENADHNASVTVGVDEDKFQQDKKKVEGLGRKAKESAADPTGNVQKPNNGP
jgi:hypothetical protein